MKDNLSHLPDRLFRPSKEPIDLPDDLPPIEDATLPDPSSDYDKAYGNVRTKPFMTLHCLMGKDGYESFTYASLAKNHKFKYVPGGHEIVLEFTDGERVRVTIRGRNLLKLYDYILQSRMPWIRKADRPFGAETKEIITAIEIQDITPE